MSILNNTPILGQIGPDGRPIGLLDAIMGVRPRGVSPIPVPNPSLTTGISNIPGINYGALQQQLGTPTQMPQEPTGIMNMMRNFFNQPKTDVVDGEKVTYVDRVQTPTKEPESKTDQEPKTDQQLENEMAESGINTDLLSAITQSGLLDTRTPQFMPIAQQQAAQGLNLQPINLAQYYGGLLG